MLIHSQHNRCWMRNRIIWCNHFYVSQLFSFNWISIFFLITFLNYFPHCFLIFHLFITKNFDFICHRDKTFEKFCKTHFCWCQRLFFYAKLCIMEGKYDMKIFQWNVSNWCWNGSHLTVTNIINNLKVVRQWVFRRGTTTKMLIV
jgi:hypothetical protein